MGEGGNLDLQQVSTFATASDTDAAKLNLMLLDEDVLLSQG